MEIQYRIHRLVVDRTAAVLLLLPYCQGCIDDQIALPLLLCHRADVGDVDVVVPQPFVEVVVEFEYWDLHCWQNLLDC